VHASAFLILKSFQIIPLQLSGWDPCSPACLLLDGLEKTGVNNVEGGTPL
jgi:hypothetical protein